MVHGEGALLGRGRRCVVFVREREVGGELADPAAELTAINRGVGALGLRRQLVPSCSENTAVYRHQGLSAAQCADLKLVTSYAQSLSEVLTGGI